MNKLAKVEYWKRIRESGELVLANKFVDAFTLLEEAHILGQRSVYHHTLVHVKMLKIGFLRRDFREFCGQLFRIPSGVLGSLIGILPTGNTGGSNLSAFKKLPVPDHLKQFIE